MAARAEKLQLASLLRRRLIQGDEIPIFTKACRGGPIAPVRRAE
jgi:hypothetical protein